MSLLLAPLLLLLLVGLVIPLGRLVLDSVTIDGVFDLGNYAKLVDRPLFPRVLLRTFQAALVTTLGCLAIGYPMAYVIHRAPRRWSRIALLLVTVPFFTSTLIRSYAWIAILGSNGLVDSAVKAVGLPGAPQLVFNRTGMFIGMIQVQLPLMILTLVAAMHRVDRSLVAAAQSLGATPARAFRHAFLPATRSGIAAGASLVFVSTLGFYVTPAMLGSQGEVLVAQSIALQFSNLVDFGGAAAQATVLLALVLVLLWFFRDSYALTLPGAAAEAPPPRRRSEAARRLASLLTKPLDAVLALLDRVRWPLLLMVFGLGLLYLVGPLVVVAISAFGDKRYLQFPPEAYSLRWFEDYLSNGRWLRATGFSVTVAAISAALSVLIGGIAAYWIVRARSRWRSLVVVACVLPIVVPQIIFGLAVFFMLAPLGLVGTPWGFILAYTVLGVPYAVLIISAALRNLDPRLERAGQSLGAPPVAVALRIVGPLVRPAILSAFVFAFIGAFDDVVVAMFMSGPSTVTISIRMWQDISLEVSPRTAAVAVVFFAVALGVAALRALAGRFFPERVRA